jgi:AraC-like DNA-binding protein
VWKYSQAIGGRRPRHFHVEPELNIVVRGTATFGVGDLVAHVSQGELIAFPPGQDHALIAASPDLYLYAVGLAPAFSTQILGREHPAGLPLHVALEHKEQALLEDRAGALVEREGADSVTAELWERSHALALRAAPRAGHALHVLTRRTLQLLSVAPELGLDDVARYLRAHPSEVSRHFHRDMGVTLVRHRTRMRLLQFIRRMDSGEKDLMTSASIAGFGSYSQAHRSFRSELGCSPREFFGDGVRERMQASYL